MRRGATAVFGFARQAAAGGAAIENGLQRTAVACGGAIAWPDSAASGGAAAAAAASSLPAAAAVTSVRGFTCTARPQHNAQPAAAEALQRQHQVQAREHPRNCWQCGTQLGAGDQFFCPECESVQPASADPQYFRVFGMDAPSFDLDVPQLERQYKALQWRLHPDKYSTASLLEQEYAHQQAAVVNQAYDVLKKPLRRAHYILNQAGFGACEGMTITDPELLMYVMEAREEVEGTVDPARLQQLLDQNTQLKQRCIKELSGAFQAGDLQHAAELTTQLRYVCRIREAIVDKM